MLFKLPLEIAMQALTSSEDDCWRELVFMGSYFISSRCVH